ncbi:hypothetical protein J4233_02470 [Candidatus Pacearchaeota archaeon]|nr:hypothetical protein [Candidatus Pacearchaeota archaeon]
MKSIFGFLILLATGYIIGTIARYNFIEGILLLIIGFGVLIWTFYKKKGWFYGDATVFLLVLFLLAKLIGFNLGVLNVISFREDRISGYILIFLMIVAILSLTLQLIRTKNKK